MNEQVASKENRFDGRVAIVTGGGRGLGASYARLLAARGAAVLVHDAGVAQDGTGFDRTVADSVVAEITTAGGSAAACYENLEDSDACARVVKCALDQFGGVDILVHNAGLVIFAAFEETSREIWDRMINLTVNAPFYLIRTALSYMRHQNYGRIVMTTSERAMRVEDCVPGLTAYCTGKMAAVGMMVGLAAELRDTGVRINTISPVAATRVLRRSAPELRPELVAPGVAFLASSGCDVSGVVLQAAGGRFSATWWSGGKEVDLGAADTPEAVAAHWRELISSSEASENSNRPRRR